MEDGFDITNYRMVAVNGQGNVVVMNPPLAPMRKEDALVFAAWLVALTGCQREEFDEILTAVLNT